MQTTKLNLLVQRMQAGDRAAQNELLRSAGARLELLARKMLRKFPSVRRWAQTDDVLQNALLRLLRALQSVQPATTRDFYNLAAVQIRRELLDLARHYFGPHGPGAHEVTAPADGSQGPGLSGIAISATEATDLERWQRYHEGVERLPVEEREVVSLIFYHGWTHAAVAELLGVSTKSVQRCWKEALVKLSPSVIG